MFVKTNLICTLHMDPVPLCQLCHHCKKPISFCKMLCFDDVRSCHVHGHAWFRQPVVKCKKLLQRQGSVLCSQREEGVRSY